MLSPSHPLWRQVQSATRRMRLCQPLHLCSRRLSPLAKESSQWCRGEDSKVPAMQAIHRHRPCLHPYGQHADIRRIAPGTMYHLHRPLHRASQPTHRGRLSNVERILDLQRLLVHGFRHSLARAAHPQSTALLQASLGNQFVSRCSSKTIRAQQTCLLVVSGFRPPSICTM